METFEKTSDINMTFRIGEMPSHVTFEMLRSIFGEPEYNEYEKTTASWAFKFSDGSVFTIYDYNSYSDPKYIKGADWHIGGRDEEILVRVLALVN